MSNAPRKERRTPQPNIAGGIVRGIWIPQGGSEQFNGPTEFSFQLGTLSKNPSTISLLDVTENIEIPITDNIEAYGITGKLTVLNATLQSDRGGVVINIAGVALGFVLIVMIAPFAPEWSLVRGLICPGYYHSMIPTAPP